MRRSFWESTLEEFRGELAGTAPAPAGVSVAAATAAFSLSLLVKTLKIAAKRQGSRQTEWIDEAMRLSSRLTELADEDTAAFDEFLRCLRLPKGSARSAELARATRATIEVPMEAARSAVRGIALCEQACAVVHAFVAPDLEAAAVMLAGSVRAMLGSVRYNLQQVSVEDAFFDGVEEERQALADDARGRADAVVGVLGGRL